VAPSPIEYDRWYDWRFAITWATGSSGRLQWWLDGAMVADWPGPTILDGDNVWLQFGFYSAAQLSNEIWHAGMSVFG
jgi:hypothetical protein